MDKQEGSRIRLMTYNIGGGRKDLGSKPDTIIDQIGHAAPDILVVQEATERQDADGGWDRDVEQIAEAGEFGRHVHWGATLSMREQMHVRKALFVHGIFSDWQDWRQGNAILSRWEFVRLGDATKPGVPKNIPLYRPPLYEGTRDTDPRYGLLARVNKAPVFPFVIGVHLTTLAGERERIGGFRPIPGKTEEAQMLRYKQTSLLLDLLREHVLDRGEVVFLLGDFNAEASEPAISAALEAEGGFVRLMPTDGPTITHVKAPQPIDHIFVYPRQRLIEYRCWIVGNPPDWPSDHYPVVADVWVS